MTTNNSPLPIEIVGGFMAGPAPIDVFALARELGVDVVAAPMRDDISGKIECDRGGPCRITVNAMHHPRRQRFTVAHEIAHYVLHRDLIGDGIEDNGKYRSKQQSDSVERQANRYAAEILMPWRLVAEKFQSGLQTPAALAREFAVSEAVAEIRLLELSSRADFCAIAQSGALSV